jgi:hypothetical protein
MATLGWITGRVLRYRLEINGSRENRMDEQGELAICERASNAPVIKMWLEENCELIGFIDSQAAPNSTRR